MKVRLVAIPTHALVFLVASALNQASATQDLGARADADTATSIRIDAPFAGEVWRLAASADGGLLAVSVSDESVLTWSPDVPAPRTLPFSRRVALPYRARALAVDPGGDWIAMATPPVRRGAEGEDGGRIDIVDALDASPIRRIEGLPTRAQALAVSPDGALLAAVLSEGCGLRVWRVADGAPVFSDDEDHGGCGMPDATLDTTGLHFGKEALLTAGASGVRRYARARDTFQRTAWRPPDAALQRPDGLALSPDAGTLAVGDRRLHDPNVPLSLGVALLNAKTLEPLSERLTLGEAYFLPAPNAPGAAALQLNRVAWHEGRVVAGGVLPCRDVLTPVIDPLIGTPGAGANCLVRWPISEASETGTPDFVVVGNEAVLDLLAVPQDRSEPPEPFATPAPLAVATHNLITLLDERGEVWLNDYGDAIEARRRFVDLRTRVGPDAPSAFDVSADGRRVLVDPYGSGPLLLFDASTLDLAVGNVERTGLVPPDRDAFLLGPIARWLNESRPPFPSPDMLREDDRLRALALFADKTRVLAGTSDTVQVVDRLSGKVLCRRRVRSEAFRVNLADDGRLAVVGHGDGTVRWYEIDGPPDACTLTERLAVNLRRAADEPSRWTWHAWIEASGRFASDASARPDLRWQIDQPDGSVTLVEAAEVIELYDRDAVRTALDERSDDIVPDTAERDAALEAAAEAAVAASIRMTGPRRGAALNEASVRLSLRVNGEGPWPRPLVLKANGRIGVAATVDGIGYAPGKPIPVDRPGALSVMVALPDAVMRSRGQFEMCFEIGGRLQRPCEILSWKGEVLPPVKPRLWAVLVGLSDYSGSDLGDLTYAQNDALDLARLLVHDHARPEALRDFTDLHIALVVGPTTTHARAELADLAAHPAVTLYPAKTRSITLALADIAARDADDALADDIVMVAYSGHGGSVSSSGSQRETWLLGPDTPKDRALAIETGAALSVSDLTAAMGAISAEQIALIDACRSFLRVVERATIDPAILRAELSRRANPIHVAFSARVGQYSPETDHFAHRRDRPDGENGNGLFLYGVLDGLTNKDADSLEAVVSRGRIELDELRTHLDNFFHGGALSYFDQVRRRLPSFVPPEPVWFAAASGSGPGRRRLFLRSLDGSPPGGEAEQN